MLLSLLLAMVMLLATGCFSGEGLKLPTKVIGDSSVTANDEPADNDSDNDFDDDSDNDSDNDQADDAVEISVAETVLYEADGVKITATGYQVDWDGPEIKILIENDSERNIVVSSDSVSANGYMMPMASLYAEVAAGKKANETLDLMSAEQSGIEVPAELQFYLQILDPDTWETVATSDLLTLTTSAAPYEQPVDDSGDVLYDSDGIRIICKGLKRDVIWDGAVVLFMENNSDREIYIYAENVSVNGFMQDLGLWSKLRPNTKLIDGMYLLDLDDLEIEDIDQIEEMEFRLRIVDTNTLEDIAVTDALTLSFK